MAEQETSKTTHKCSACIYRKWYGDYALYVCEISGKVIEPFYYCNISDEVIKDYINIK